MGNDDYPPTNFKGSGFWKYKAPIADKKADADGKNKLFKNKKTKMEKKKCLRTWTKVFVSC